MNFDGFIGGSTPSRSPNYESEDTINYYVEVGSSQGKKAPAALMPTPGMVEVIDLVQGPSEALFYLPNPDAVTGLPRAFAVNGYVFYELFCDAVTNVWSALQRGTVDNNGEPASMASNGDNGDQLLVVAGRYGNIFNLSTNTWTPHVVSNVDVCAMVDGYFLAIDLQSSTFKISALNDGTTWTYSTQRSSAPDRWMGMGVVRKQVWLPGSQSADVYQDSGVFPFPFTPIPDTFFTHGIAATFSMATLGKDEEEYLVWLGQSSRGIGPVYRTSGLGVVTITTPEMETEFNKYANADGVSDARAFSFQMDGHTFYVLTFPSSNMTWIYNEEAGPQMGWTKWLTWNTATGAYEAVRPATHMYAFGQHIVGDRANGLLYRLGNDIPYDAGGALIRRVRQCPHIVEDKNVVMCKRFELDMDVGYGNPVPPGDDPMIYLQVSYDGLKTWSPEIGASIGKIGEYLIRPMWRGLGASRDFGFRTIVTAPVLPGGLSSPHLDLEEADI